MDGHRFDTIARSLALGVSRRSFVRALGGAGLLGWRGRANVGAAPPEGTCQAQLGGHCTIAIPCCSGLCDDDGRCGCLPGKVPCTGRCVDPARCDACGNSCGAGRACCDGVCVFLEADERHCGSCGVACGEGGTCCVGRCVVLGSDPHHCAECGHTCGEGICVDGQCRTCRGPGDFHGPCRDDAECCSGACCSGECCAEGYVCLGGACCGASSACGDVCCPSWSGCVDGRCESCPPETICTPSTTGKATCGAYTTEGLCCLWPEWAACCCESRPGAGDGWAGCCLHEGPDANCPPCVGAIKGMSCAGGPATKTCDTEPFPECCHRGSHLGGGNCQTACAAGEMA